MAARTLVFRWGLRLVCTAYITFLVGIPMGGIVWRALEHGFGHAYDQVTTPNALHALVLTLWTGALALVFNTVFGVGIALALARRRFPGKGVVEALIDLPLSISPVVIGFAILLTYSSTEGLFGPWLAHHGITVLFSYPAVVMAVAFVSLPYVVREVLPVLLEIGTEQEQAAETLGAGPLVVFWRITLPSIRWGLAYGVLLTSARILGEYGAVSVVSGDIIGHTQTLTQYVNYDFDNFDTPGAYAGALLLALISVVLLVALGAARRSRTRDAE